MKSDEASDIYNSLRVSLQLIDRAVARLDASRLFAGEPHRVRLISAMVELLEVTESLHASRPELHQAGAGATRLESSYNELFRSAVTEALAFEAEGRFDIAAARYSQFLGKCRSHVHRALARSEYQRLQCLAAGE